MAMTQETKRNLALVASFSVLALISVLPSGQIAPRQETASVFEAIHAKEVVRKDFPTIEAKTALVYDYGAHTALYEKDADIPMPMASLTKIITISYVLDHANTDEKVAISPHALATPGNSLLVAGDVMTVRDLAAMAMVESSNDAVMALVEHIAKKDSVAPNQAERWILPHLQLHAESLGASHVTLTSVTGLDSPAGTAGAYGSARDLVNITGKTLGSEMWGVENIDTVISEKGRVYHLKPTNEIKDGIPVLLGSKTGLTDVAGGNLLVTLEYPIGNPVGIVVMGSSAEGRFRDVQAIYAWLTGK